MNSNRVLVVGMTDSPHLKKWLDAVVDLEVINKIFVFPSTGYDRYVKSSNSISETLVKMAVPFTGTFFGKCFRFLLDAIFKMSWRKFLLNLVIKIHRPSVVHIHEIQHGGYIFERKDSKIYPVKKVICSSWGSDLILYGKLPSHEDKLAKFLRNVDLLLTERQEELEIASKLGFIGRSISPVYTSIGVDTDMSQIVIPSKRKKIVIKGYQDNHGRALNALQALERVDSELNKFEIIVVSASPSVILEVERLHFEKGWNIRCLPKQTQSAILNLLSDSRIYIGLSISDGLSTMMVEAMHSGTFPIQSVNSGAPAFLEHGISGFIVDPWDLSAIANSIDTAIMNDELVDSAASINYSKLKSKFDLGSGLEILRNIYEDLD